MRLWTVGARIRSHSRSLLLDIGDVHQNVFSTIWDNRHRRLSIGSYVLGRFEGRYVITDVSSPNYAVVRFLRAKAKRRPEILTAPKYEPSTGCYLLKIPHFCALALGLANLSTMCNQMERACPTGKVPLEVVVSHVS